MKPVIPMGSLPLTPPVRGSHNLKGCSHRLEGGQALGISFFGLPRMAVREAGLVMVQNLRFLIFPKQALFWDLFPECFRIILWDTRITSEFLVIRGLSAQHIFFEVLLKTHSASRETEQKYFRRFCPDDRRVHLDCSDCEWDCGRGRRTASRL